MKNKENSFVSVVVYIYNQKNLIREYICSLINILRNNFNNYEIICVNDFSDDESAEEINEAAKQCADGSFISLNMGCHHGLENSMEAGVDFASGDFVFEFDILSMDSLEFIMSVYERCLEGYDIVSASPQNSSRSSSKLFYFIFNKSVSTQFALKTESFRIISRRAINRVKQMSISLPNRKVVYANCGLKMSRIEYTSTSGLVSHKYRHSERIALAVDSFVIFTNIANKISFIFSVLMLIFSVFLAGYTIIVFVGNNPIPGWTTTMLALSFGFFGLFTLLSIIIKYLSLILRMIFKKSRYIIESIEKL